MILTYNIITRFFGKRVQGKQRSFLVSAVAMLNITAPLLAIVLGMMPVAAEPDIHHYEDNIDETNRWGVWYDDFAEDDGSLDLSGIEQRSGIAWSEGGLTLQAREWTAPRLVINNGSDWGHEPPYDIKSAFSPSILKDTRTTVFVPAQQKFKLWYSADNGGTTRILYTYGFNTLGFASKPITIAGGSALDPGGARDPHVILDMVDETFHMWYTGLNNQGVESILYKTTQNPDSFGTSQNAFGQIPNTITADDGGASQPSVLKIGDKFHMWYTGTDGSGMVKTILHRSSDDGTPGSWSSPEIAKRPSTDPDAMDSNSVAGANVIRISNGDFRMIYSGYDGEYWRLFEATSRTPTGFDEGISILDNVDSPSKYDNHGAEDPFLFPIDLSNNIFYLYYSGFDGDQKRVLASNNNIGQFGDNYQVTDMNTVQSDNKDQNYAVTVVDTDDPEHGEVIYTAFEDYSSWKRRLPDDPPCALGDIDIYLMKSTNGGLTFSTRTKVNDYDPDNVRVTSQGPLDIAIDKFGTLYLSWIDNRRGLMQTGSVCQRDIYMSKSTDGGETWDLNVKINSGIQRLGDPSFIQPSLAIDDSRAKTQEEVLVFATWIDTRFDGDGDVFAARSINGGRSFQEDVAITSREESMNPMYPDIAVVCNGDVLVSYTDREHESIDPPNASFQLYTSLSNDKGVSYAGEGRVNEPRNNAMVSMVSQVSGGIKNNAYIVWQDKRNGNSDIYFSLSKMCGASRTWGPNRRVNTVDIGSYQQSNPKIFVDDVGHIYVLWEDDMARPGVATKGRLNFTKSTDDGATWPKANVQTVTSVSASVQYTNPRFPYLFVDQRRNVHVSWHGLNMGAKDIYYTRMTAQPFANKGYAVSIPIEIPDIENLPLKWDMLKVNKTEPNSFHFVEISILKEKPNALGEYEPFSYLEDLRSTDDLILSLENELDAGDIPTIRLGAKLYGDGTSSPILFNWSVSWRSKFEPPLKDLDIDLYPKDLELSNHNPNKGDLVYINVTVGNSGNETAPNVLIKLYVDDVSRTFIYKTLYAKSENTISFLYRFDVPGPHNIRIFVDPNDNAREPADKRNNNAVSEDIFVTNFFRDFGLGILNDATHYTQAADPTTFTLGVVNTGNLNISIKLFLTGHFGDWSVELNETRVTLAPGQIRELSLTVEPPADTPDEEKLIVTVNGTRVYYDYLGRERVDPSIAHHIIATTVVGTFGFALISFEPVKWAYPGTPVEFRVDVNNNQFFADTIEVLVTGTKWNFGIGHNFEQRINISMEKSGTEALYIIVEVPENETAGNFAEVVVRGRSLTADISSNLELTTIVLQVFDLQVNKSDEFRAIEPGSSARFPIQVSNNGNGVDEINFTFEEYPVGWNVTLSEEVLTLNISQTKTVWVNIQTPIKTPKDIYPIAVNYTSESTWDDPYYFFKISINATYGVNLTDPGYVLTLPNRIIEYKTTLTNSGNTQDFFTLGIDTTCPTCIPGGWLWNATHDGEAIDSFRLEPFESINVSISMEVPYDAEARIYDVLILVQSDNNPTSNTTLGILEVEPVPEFLLSELDFGATSKSTDLNGTFHFSESDLITVETKVNNTSRIPAYNVTVMLKLDGEVVDSTYFDVIPNNKSVVVVLHYWSADPGEHEVLVEVIYNYRGLISTAESSKRIIVDKITKPATMEEAIQWVFLAIILASSALLAITAAKTVMRRRNELAEKLGKNR